VDKVHRQAVDRLPRPTTGGVVLERRGDGTRDARQTVPRIPRVATRAVAEQVPVEIGREDLTAKGEVPVGGIVARRVQGRRQTVFTRLAGRSAPRSRGRSTEMIATGDQQSVGLTPWR